MSIQPPLSVLLILGAPLVVLIAVFRGTSLAGRFAERRVVVEAQRVLGGARPTRRWLRPAVMTAVTWLGVELIAAPYSPRLGVWAGGVVVAVGAAVILRAYPDRLAPEEFDRALQRLLDQT